MRDRLIELLLKCEKENDVLSCYNERPRKVQAAEIIADHLLANGIVVLPCKIGTRVYRLIPDLSVTWPDPSEYKIIWDTFKLDDIYTFGKTVFLTKELAEKALAERSGE